jgi:metal-sulfur cluster biosynthetic enzyme
MTEEMKARIDRVLEAIRDTDSCLTIAQMNLVERVRYSPQANLMTVFTRAMRHTRGCCTLLALTQQSRLLGQLEQEFKKEFPESWVRMENV